LHGHTALSIKLNRWRYALVRPCPVTKAVKLGFMIIFIFNLYLTFGKNSFVMADFEHLSHSVCHFSMTTSFNSLYNVLVGILL
jgi:hypothetical protein